MNLSIIVCVYNEAQVIEKTLNHLLTLGAFEIIVVDGGSADGTLEILRKTFPQVQLIPSNNSMRSEQLNQGVAIAKGDVLLFCHADMKLPNKSLKLIDQAMKPSHIIGGGFMKQYSPSNLWMDIYSWMLNTIYLKGLKKMVGTNAIFIRKEVFAHMKGFKNIQFLEDVELSERMRRIGSLAFVSDKVTVSSRRYIRTGILKQVWINGRILFGYFFLGEDIHQLKQKYLFETQHKKMNYEFSTK